MVLVVGATGSLGGKIARQLLARGAAVRILVRDPRAARTLGRAGAQVVGGDLRVAASLADACRGVSRVITTAGAPLMERHLQAATDAVDWHGTARLIDAALDAGVTQLAYVSCQNARPDAPHPLAYAKGRSELYLKESGLTYTVIVPAPFMEFWIGYVLGAQLRGMGTITLIGDGNGKIGFVSSRNVCDLAVAALGHAGAANATLPLAGLSAHSFREAIAYMEQARRQTIRVRTVPPGERIPGLPQAITDLWALLATAENGSPDPAATARDFGLALTPLESYIAQTFGDRCTGRSQENCTGCPGSVDPPGEETPADPGRCIRRRLGQS